MELEKQITGRSAPSLVTEVNLLSDHQYTEVVATSSNKQSPSHLLQLLNLGAAKSDWPHSRHPQ